MTTFILSPATCPKVLQKILKDNLGYIWCWFLHAIYMQSFIIAIHDSCGKVHKIQHDYI